MLKINKESIDEMFVRIIRKFVKSKEDQQQYIRIFSLTWPAFIELFLTSFFSVVDVMMVGRLGAAAISGVGLTNQPFFLLIAIFSAVNVGTTTLVAWGVGANDRKKVSKVANNAVFFNIILGIILTIVGILTARPVMNFINKDLDTVNYATDFMQIICFGLIFQAITMCISAIFRGSGQTKIPMIYNILSNFVNVFLNFCLIFGKLGLPALGVRGAAIATTVSRAMACFMSIYAIFFWKRSPIRIKLEKNFRPDISILKEIFSIGMPAAGEQFVIQGGLIIFSKIISAIGVSAYAAHQIVSNVNSMAFSVSNAFAVSTTALVGHSIGLNDYDLAEELTKKTRKLARLITGIIAIILALLGKQITMLYNKEPEVISEAVPIFIFLALIQFMQSTQMSTSGALRGAGDTMYPLYSSILGIWIFRVPVTYIFVKIFNWGLIGAWFAFFLDQTTRLIIVNLRFKSGKWRTIKNLKIKND